MWACIERPKWRIVFKHVRAPPYRVNMLKTIWIRICVFLFLIRFINKNSHERMWIFFFLILKHWWCSFGSNAKEYVSVSVYWTIPEHNFNTRLIRISFTSLLKSNKMLVTLLSNNATSGNKFCVFFVPLPSTNK